MWCSSEESSWAVGGFGRMGLSVVLAGIYLNVLVIFTTVLP